MQIGEEQEMADLLQSCLASLDEIGAAFIEDCWLREPKVSLLKFSQKWQLSPKAMSQLRTRVLLQMKELLGAKGVESVKDIY